MSFSKNHASDSDASQTGNRAGKFVVNFFGVRGSIATPGPDTVEVGGNTSCVEVQCGDRHIVLDTGTGMRQLGQRFLRDRKRVQLSVFYSHMHWDHIQGLPFFTPVYIPGTEIDFHGPKGLPTALEAQMSDPGFPVRFGDVPARMSFNELTEGATIRLDTDTTVTCAKLNHPGGVLAYRIQYKDHAVVYATDTEHYSCPDPKLVRLAQGADLLIYDAQYDDDEYAGRRGAPRTGWGHSTFTEGVRIADAAEVKQLALYHHDPAHCDAHVRRIEEAAQRLRPGTFACREGLSVAIDQSASVASAGFKLAFSRQGRSMNGFLLPLEEMPKVHRLAAGATGASGGRDGAGDGGREGAPDRRSVLLALLDLVRTEVDLDSLLRRVVDLVGQAMAADRATLFMIDPNTGELVSRAAHLPELPEIRLAKGQGIVGHVALTQKPVNIPHADAHPQFASGIDKLTGYKTNTVLAVPVLGKRAPDGGPRELLGVIEVLNKKHGIFNDADRELLVDLADEVATVLTVTTLPQRVTGQTPERYHRIIGSSPLMQRVYDIIARAAATTATVLVCGESGTGKELAARAIHYNSQRARGPFIKIDCTSIPEGLMESELFGHERGAFTGAEQRVLGKAELASGGTLFLDEIGDLKSSLQGKLLRLLQDREFERVGGRKTIAVDVRIVAATNRDLQALALGGQFRADLYYRLKVIELELPPLRMRGSDDIERLALHFVELYAHRHKKPVRGLHRDAVDRLRAHTWPGNIRELEHCIESAVALCAGDQIMAADLPLPMSAPVAPAASSRSLRPAAAPPSSTRSLRPTIGEGPFEPSGELTVPLLPPSGTGLHIPEGLTLEEVEQRYLAYTITRYGGNRSEAARALGIGRNTLLRKLRETQNEN